MHSVMTFRLLTGWLDGFYLAWFMLQTRATHGMVPDGAWSKQLKGCKDLVGEIEAWQKYTVKRSHTIVWRLALSDAEAGFATASTGNFIAR
jgi:hypothetical protein